MNPADEHLLKALVLAPTLLNTIDVKGDLPKSLTFVDWYRGKTATLKWGQFATSYEIAQILLRQAKQMTGEEQTETTRLGNQILNIMRGNGRGVP